MTRMVLEPSIALEAEHNHMKVVLRTDPVHGLEVNRVGEGKVDTESHTIDGAIVVQEGVTKDERFEIDRKFLDSIVKAGNSADRGIRVRFDHPTASARSLGTYMGRASGFRRRGNRVLASIELSEVAASSPDGDLLKYIEELAVNEPDSFAMSIVFTTAGLVYRRDEDGDLATDDDGNVLPPIPRLRKLWAVDFVDEGAATDTLLGSGTPADVMSKYLDKYFQSRGLLEEGKPMPKKKPKPDASQDVVPDDATLEPEPEQTVALSAEAPPEGAEMAYTPSPEKVVVASADGEIQSESAIREERKRVINIQALGRALGQDELANAYVESGASLSDATNKLLEAHASKSKTVAQTITNPGDVTVGADERDKFRRQMSLVLQRKAGIQLSDEEHREIGSYGNWNLLAIAQLCCERAGMKVDKLDKMALASIALDNSGIAAQHFGVGVMGTSTSDLPYLLENVVNKSMQIAYGQAATTWQEWTKRGSVPDFKEFSRVRVSESDELELVLEGGEFQDSSITDKVERGKVLTYGRIFSVTRQTLVNDDLAEVTRQPTRFGFAAARLVDNLLYTDLLSDPLGPDMMDPNPTGAGGTENKLFNDGTNWPDGRANYAAGANTELTVDGGQAAINEANLLMRKRKGMKYEQRLNIMPWRMLVTPEYEMNARILLRSISNVTDAKNAGVINPWVGFVEPIVVPHLSDTTKYTNASLKQWYLVANPMQVDTYEVFFLDGWAQPTMEQEVGFIIDGLKYKVRMDVGVKCIDTAGMVKMKGEV